MINEEYFDLDENEEIDGYTDPEELDLDDEDLETLDDNDSEEEEGEEY